MKCTDNEKISFPSIIFKVKGELYSINSEHVETILQLPQHEPVPDARPAITGVFMHRGHTVTMLDLRTVLEMPTLEQEYIEFCEMLEARKQDHIHWVEELERTAKAGEPFTLATDPHKCKLGRWYDHFECEIQEVNFHLRKIEAPHKRLHEAAVEVAGCSQDCPACSRAECLKNVLARVRGECMPKILKLLDETKDIFRTTVYHEMALVLRGERKLGIIVDEVIAVEDLVTAGDQSTVRAMRLSPCVAGVEKSEKQPDLILALDLEKIIAAADADC